MTRASELEGPVHDAAGKRLILCFQFRRQRHWQVQGKKAYSREGEEPLVARQRALCEASATQAAGSGEMAHKAAAFAVSGCRNPSGPEV